MSIASRITQIEEHIGDIYDTLELGGDSTQNKNIVNINSEIKREYKDFLANGTDTLWNNWDKVSGTGESLTLNNTIKAKMEIEYGGNTSQEGTPTPDSPQDIHIVSGDNTLTIGDGTDSTTYPINLPNGMYLGKIGDYKDRIYHDNGKWYLEKKIGKVVLDGSEDWQYVSSNGVLYVENVITNRLIANELSYCNMYKFYGYISNSGELTENNKYAFQNTLEVVYGRILIKDTRFTSASDFKTWLSTHNTIVYYVLATPTITEITDATLISQLEAIKYSYNNQTNISQTNDDLPIELSVTALESLE